MLMVMFMSTVMRVCWNDLRLIFYQLLQFSTVVMFVVSSVRIGIFQYSLRLLLGFFSCSRAGVLLQDHKMLRRHIFSLFYHRWAAWIIATFSDGQTMTLISLSLQKNVTNTQLLRCANVKLIQSQSLTPRHDAWVFPLSFKILLKLQMSNCSILTIIYMY